MAMPGLVTPKRLWELDLATVAASLSFLDSFREVKSLNLNHFSFEKMHLVLADSFGG